MRNRNYTPTFHGEKSVDVEECSSYSAVPTEYDIYMWRTKCTYLSTGESRARVPVERRRELVGLKNFFPNSLCCPQGVAKFDTAEPSLKYPLPRIYVIHDRAALVWTTAAAGGRKYKPSSRLV